MSLSGCFRPELFSTLRVISARAGRADQATGEKVPRQKVEKEAARPCYLLSSILERSRFYMLTHRRAHSRTRGSEKAVADDEFTGEPGEAEGIVRSGASQKEACQTVCGTIHSNDCSFTARPQGLAPSRRVVFVLHSSFVPASSTYTFPAIARALLPRLLLPLSFPLH